MPIFSLRVSAAGTGFEIVPDVAKSGMGLS
jgi:hypothetical protein